MVPVRSHRQSSGPFSYGSSMECTWQGRASPRLALPPSIGISQQVVVEVLPLVRGSIRDEWRGESPPIFPVKFAASFKTQRHSATAEMLIALRFFAQSLQSIIGRHRVVNGKLSSEILRPK